MIRSKWKNYIPLFKTFYSLNLSSDTYTLRFKTRKFNINKFLYNISIQIYTGHKFIPIIIKQVYINKKLGQLVSTRYKNNSYKILDKKLKYKI